MSAGRRGHTVSACDPTAWYLIAAVLFASGLAHLACRPLSAGLGRPGLPGATRRLRRGVGLTLWAVAWVSGFLKVRPAVLAWFAAASVVEVVVRS